MSESSRITGLAYHNGAVYVSRAGEVGFIPDNGVYAPLAGGFAVQSQLFHANNGLAVLDGWLYVSTGGIRDGYSDGLIENHSEKSTSWRSGEFEIRDNLWAAAPLPRFLLYQNLSGTLFDRFSQTMFPLSE